jgi:hypothetical protein
LIDCHLDVRTSITTLRDSKTTQFLVVESVEKLSGSAQRAKANGAVLISYNYALQNATTGRGFDTRTLTLDGVIGDTYAVRGSCCPIHSLRESYYSPNLLQQ